MIENKFAIKNASHLASKYMYCTYVFESNDT